METLQNISSVSTRSNFRFRSVLIVAGIAIAVICSLVSLKSKDASAFESIKQESVVSPASLSNVKMTVISVVAIVKSDVFN